MDDLSNMKVVQEKVYLVSRRWNHHATHSGYDRLGRIIGTTLTSNPVPDYLLPDHIYWKLARDMRGYDRTSLALELLALKHMTTHKGCLYHFLYGENAYRYLGKLNLWRNHKLVATYHHPPQAFTERVRTLEHVRKLSAVIVVGRNQLASFKGILPDGRLFFVPHPVDTTFFSPPKGFWERDNDLCLFVGAHLRDFQTLRSVIENAWIIAPNLRFAVVVHPLHLDKFKGVVGNYTIYCKIEEAELLNLYRKATLLIMPLKDTTANNSVLEAMSCGLPIVVTDVGAIEDYVSEECAHFVSPFEPHEMLEAILNLLDSGMRRKLMAESARERAMDYDLRKIAKQLQSVYIQILGNGS